MHKRPCDPPECKCRASRRRKSSMHCSLAGCSYCRPNRAHLCRNPCLLWPGHVRVIEWGCDLSMQRGVCEPRLLHSFLRGRWTEGLQWARCVHDERGGSSLPMRLCSQQQGLFRQERLALRCRHRAHRRRRFSRNGSAVRRRIVAAEKGSERAPQRHWRRSSKWIVL